MPTSVINPRVVLIVRLTCHDENVYERKSYFAKQVKVQVQLLVQRLKDRIYTERSKAPNFAWL